MPARHAHGGRRLDAAMPHRTVQVARGPAGALLIFAASRGVVLVAAALSAFLLSFLGPGPALNQTVGDGLGRWDGVWYLRVAAWGYPHHVTLSAADIRGTTTSFFPLYPLAIRFVHALTGTTPLRAALVVVAVAGAADSVLVWALAARVWGRRCAHRACALFCFFPGAFILSLAYAEAVMLSLVLGCLLALSLRRWLLAGVLAALATATRPNALPVVVCCAWAAGAAVVARREWRALLAPLVAPTGFVAFCAFLWRRTGSAAAWFTVERTVWRERIDVGAVSRRLGLFAQHPWRDIDITVFVVALAMTVLGVVMMVRAGPPVEWWLWTAGVIGLAAGSATLGLRPRFVLSAFPLVIAGARDLDGPLYFAALGASAASMVVLTVVDLTGLFVP